MVSQTQEIDCIDFDTIRKKRKEMNESGMKRSLSADFVGSERDRIISIVTEEHNINLLKSLSSVCKKNKVVYY